MIEQRQRITADAFEELLKLPENADRRLELINGEVVEKTSPTELHGMIVINIAIALQNYAFEHKVGRVTSDARHREPDDEKNIRRPDVSFRKGADPVVRKGAVPRMPDLAVEVLSPNDALRQAREKARYYLSQGTQIVWLVLPEQRLIEVYTPEAEAILTDADTLSGGDLLPGFSLPVRAAFADPMADA